MPFRRKLLLASLMLAVMVGILEIGSALVLKVAASRLDHAVMRTSAIYAEQTELIRDLLRADTAETLLMDSVLGWKYRSNFRDDSTALNSIGVRSVREYAPAAPPGVLRVSAFGDSFVYGTEVPVEEAWESQVERADSTIELLNYGVGGYGVDQAFMRYQREGRDMHPSVVIIGFTTDDLRRLVNVYRRFLSTSEFPLFKPRYKLDGDSLVLIANPVRGVAEYQALINDPRRVREYGKNDQWFEPLIYNNPLHDWSATTRLLTAVWIRSANRYLRTNRVYDGNVFNERSEAFRLQLAIFKAFADSVARNGATPVILLLPDRESVAARRNGGRTLYDPLLQRAKGLGVSILDASDAFAASGSSTPVEDWFRPGGHYSRSGNQIVAEWIAPKLRQLPVPN